MAKEDVSRRSFLKAAGVAAAGMVAAPALASCTQAKAAADTSWWMPAQWDREVDIVVVGTGGGGLVAGLTAQENGDEVLVLEKAPEGEEGGNSRVCGQLIYCPKSVSGAVEYQKNLNGLYHVDEEVLQEWAEAMVALPDLLTGYGANLVEYGSMNPEFPGMGGEGVARVFYIDQPFFSSAWNFLKEMVDDEGVEILYGTPGRRLIQNPETREIVGIVAGEEGSEIHIKARKGVLLACGGFENNQRMARDYLPDMTTVAPLGTPYNTGDGIVMAQAVGADLWHMNSLAGPYLGFRHPELEIGLAPTMVTVKHILVNGGGKRFVNEDTISDTKHGKIEVNGRWAHLPTPLPVYQIFDDTNFDATGVFAGVPFMTWSGIVAGIESKENNDEELAAGWITHATSIEELAAKINLDPAVLKETVDTYNANAANNVDPDFGRGAARGGLLIGEESDASDAYELLPLTGPNYYAIEFCATMLNTQGGPRRNGKGQILDTAGSPIPRLYSTGELGAPYPFLYNGGGNLGETIAFGRVGANEIAKLEAWDA
ncbi:MAG: FAD-binding protein [Eggerthellaceae bacterium]|jgi:hypothetical protein|nr:FAD-binding protein [Eggerthellaceae bacterium]